MRLNHAPQASQVAFVDSTSCNSQPVSHVILNENLYCCIMNNFFLNRQNNCYPHYHGFTKIPSQGTAVLALLPIISIHNSQWSMQKILD